MIYLLVAGIIPLLVGAIWYHEKVFGKVWLSASGVSEEKAKSGNMLVIFGLTYLFGVFIAFTMMELSIHQLGVAGVLMNEPGFDTPGSDMNNYFMDFMSKYGQNFRDAKHGFIHGGLACITFAFPVIAILSLFERRGWKYIWIHTGYWFVTLAVMGALICALV